MQNQYQIDNSKEISLDEKFVVESIITKSEVCPNAKPKRQEYYKQLQHRFYPLFVNKLTYTFLINEPVSLFQLPNPNRYQTSVKNFKLDCLDSNNMGLAHEKASRTLQLDSHKKQTNRSYNQQDIVFVVCQLIKGNSNSKFRYDENLKLKKTVKIYKVESAYISSDKLKEYDECTVHKFYLVQNEPE